jgi:hypothetical protein
MKLAAIVYSDKKSWENLREAVHIDNNSRQRQVMRRWVEMRSRERVDSDPRTEESAN